MKPVLALLTVTLLSGVRVSSAAPVDFIPKFAWFGGEYEMEAGYISEGKDRDGVVTRNQLRGIEHKIDFQTLGYVYHPSLVYFEGNVSLNLDDEARRSADSSGDGEWRGYKSAREEYVLDGIVLGRKPLNLDFHISEERPFLTSNYVNSTRTVGLFRSRVSLNYKKKQLISSLSYDHNKDETIVDAVNGVAEKNSNSISDAVAARFSYGTDKYSVNTYLRHSETVETTDNAGSQERGSKKTQSEFGVNSTIKYKRYVFANIVELANWEENTKERFRGLFREDIDIALPWNMDSEVNLYYEQKDENSYDLLGTFTDHKTNKDKRIYAVLHHKLFDSVSSTLSGDYQHSEATTSSRISQRYLLGAHYRKKLRHGGIDGIAENELYITEQQGTPFIDGERQSEKVEFVGDTITVGLPRARSETIAIEVFNTECSFGECEEFGVDPVTGFKGAWQVVSRDQWVVVDPTAQFLKVEFKRDGAIAGDPALDPTAFSPVLQSRPYTNLIRVSYSQPKADFKVQSNTSSLSVNISLFDKLFYGYFDHLLTSQEYLDGDHTFGELAPTVTEDEIGVALAKRPFDGDTSYRIVTSDLRNEWRWKFKANYGQNANLFYKINVNWGANYLQEKLWEEDSLGVVLQSSEKDFNARVGVSSAIPYTPLLATMTSTYLWHRGGVNQHDINKDGIWETISSTVDNEDKDTYTHRLNLGMMLPFVKMKINFYGSYKTEHFIALDDWVVTRDLGVNTGRSKSWKFGGTRIILDGSYNYDISEVARVSNTHVESNSRTADGEFEINLKIKRAFY